ncbi:hypothetical protein [Haloferax sp. Atlit-4N]|uniref:hypothetical protein n=1 Tax=Haloferax sp. Atlit-4N TaxID=2077206 RepID=UPI0011C067E3|nr:hypothetical protein [Haloferax sp. Atlit-4N]
MTTFTYSPRFFEQTVLPALRDKNLGDEIALLVDSKQYDSTLNDQGSSETLLHGNYTQPRYAGQRYHFAPISAGQRRAFHPKVHLLTSERRVQATISSANLTHPGLTSNQEIATCFTIDAPPSETSEGSNAGESTSQEIREKAALCLDISAYFEDLLDSRLADSVDPVTTGTISRTIDAGGWLKDIPKPDTNERSTYFLHNLHRPLLAQVREIIREAGEQIQQVDILAPFYGNSLAVPSSFTSDGIETRLWLQNTRAQISKPKLSAWLRQDLASARSYEHDRYVHAKILLIRTNTAVYCLSGSPNASHAALLSSALADTGNVEAAILRRSVDQDNFDYLLSKDPISNAEPISIDTFVPGEELPMEGSTPSPDDRSSDVGDMFELYGVSYRRRESYDSGTLTVTGRAGTSVKEVINEGGAELVVQSQTNQSGDSQSVVPLRAHEFDWAEDEDEGSETFTVSVDRYGDSSQQPFIETGKGRLKCGDRQTSRRWIQTHTPTAGDATPRDIVEAGATTVPRAVSELYLGDEARRGELITSLNGLLTSLRTVTQQEGSEDTDSESSGDDSPRGGLKVRPWTQSNKTDPDGLVESFYSGWKSDLEGLRPTCSSETYYFEEVENRLKAINATTVQLLVLDEAYPDLSIPREHAIIGIKDIYTLWDTSHTNLESRVAYYCSYLRLCASKQSQSTEEVYDGLQSHVLPHILLAAVIAESHIAQDYETYFKQQSWAFEKMIGQCYPDGYPRPDDLSDERIDELVTTINDSLEGIRERIQGSRRLKRHADERYMDKNQLRTHVVELLARAILFAEHSDSAREYDYAGRQRTIERVNQEFKEYLP